LLDPKTIEETLYNFAPLNPPNTGVSADRKILQPVHGVSGFNDYTNFLPQFFYPATTFQALDHFRVPATVAIYFPFLSRLLYLKIVLTRFLCKRPKVTA
jgi:hypothetical protein